MNRFQLWYTAQPRAIRFLLTVNVAAYLLWQVVLIHFDASRMFVLQHMAFNPSLPGILFEPWQLLTYSFLHLSPGLGGLLHILFNMLWMIWIGRDFEAVYGSGRLFVLYVYGAVGGALLTVLLHAAFPGAGMFAATVHGASGAVLGIMTAVAIQHPDKSIALMFIGVVRLIHVVIGFIALDILFLASGGTSVSAHLGGILAGFLAGKAVLAGRDPAGWGDVFFGKPGGGRRSRRGSAGGAGFMERLERRLASRKEPGEGSGSASGRSGSGGGSARIHRMPSRAAEAEESTDSGSSDVDRILDKISESGYESLTAKEKRILYEAAGK